MSEEKPLSRILDVSEIAFLHDPAQLRQFVNRQEYRFFPHIPINPRLLALALGQIHDKNNKPVVARPKPDSFVTFKGAGDPRHNMRTNIEDYQSLLPSIPYILWNTSDIAKYVRKQDHDLNPGRELPPCTNLQAVKASLICALGFMHAAFRKVRPWDQIGDHVAELSRTHRGMYAGLSRYVNKDNSNEPFNPERFVDFVFHNGHIYEHDGIDMQACPAPRAMILGVANTLASTNTDAAPQSTPLAHNLRIGTDFKSDTISSFCRTLQDCQINWPKMNLHKQLDSGIFVNSALGY